ncbi:hypothetical protein [Pseudolabrys sp. FHR47]|uniref:hypothetical protein n=1 Tax=Pseudolabrys sp. FHR47 TaxID=2562284 RepID=UPI0010BF3DDD|nr:hypothetical protein [Pseudolabrys sp. FHR47]
MRLAFKEAPPLQPDADFGHDDIEQAKGWTNLMTPARRAALDALEREFHELVVQGILRTAGR